MSKHSHQYKFLQGLNSAQYEAVTTGSRSALVLAGAGSGKTRILTARIAWLLAEKKLDPTQILALTFTNKAAKEMRMRVQELAPNASEVLLSTFHSFGVQFLREYAALIKFPYYFSIYDDNESLQLIKSILPDRDMPELKHIYYQIQRWKDGSLNLADQVDVQDVFEKFNQALRKSRAVDFGDLIYLPVQYLQQYPSLAETVKKRWKAILVDEYQDTNMRQAQWLGNMISEKTYVTIVGDDDQSIYKFRGAEPTNMIDFTHQFAHTITIKLEENYRSSQPILNCANMLINHNTGRIGKTLYSQRKEGPPPVFHGFDQQESENGFICELIEASPGVETAILYRTNAQSRSIETALTLRQIPYRIIGALRFYQREEIKTILAWLTFLVNQHDQASFMRLCEKPTRGMGKKTLQTIFSFFEESSSLLDAMKSAMPVLSHKAKLSCQALIALFQKWQVEIELAVLPVFVKQLLIESGLLDFYDQQDKSQQRERITNIESLVSSMATYPVGKAGLAQFLEHVLLQQELTQDGIDDKEMRVSLMTIHNAKGLEFDQVILVGMESGLFPREDISNDELEEERRLCYVGITRAKTVLHLTYVREKNVYGKWVHHGPSRFVYEIGEENLMKEQVLERAKTKIVKIPVTGMAGQRFEEGEWVRHKEYGNGEIIKVAKVSGRYIVEIMFESGRYAKFLPEFIILEKVAKPQ
ncbi:MAG: ATP-dependent helicase [Spirochaetia bacterium]